MYVGKVKGKQAKLRSKVHYARDRAAGIIQYFDSEREAREFAEDYNSSQRRRAFNLPPTNRELKKYTARHIILSYIAGNSNLDLDDYDKEDLSSEDGPPSNTKDVLWNFQLRKICLKNLHEFDTSVAEQYRDDRLKETYTIHNTNISRPYSPRSVRRELTMISGAWDWAKKNINGLSHLQNPWKGIKVKGATGGKRQRGLKKGELERLIDACDGCLQTNREYIPLAIWLTVETAMRRQEVINLRWDDIDFDTNRITIRESKTDNQTGNEGRVIVLPTKAKMLLGLLAASLATNGRLPEEKTAVPEEFRPPEGRVFMDTNGKAMSGDALSDAFDAVVERAGLVDLHFHDLRAAAEMEFHRAGLIPKEIDIMKNGPKGHYDVLDIYLELIQTKLERYRLKGRTEAEIEIEMKEELLRRTQEGIQAGLSQEQALEEAKAGMLAQRKEKLRSALTKHQNQSA